MKKQKAVEIAQNWIAQNPTTLDPTEVFNVLKALEFNLKREVKKDTTFIFTHNCLGNNDYFKFNSLYISVNHGKGKKPIILVGSVKPIIKAISLHPDIK